jgi:hypothetical protein
MRWNVRSINHLHDEWEISFNDLVVGRIYWVRSMRHPELTKRRIIDGLNEVHGIVQPSRTWSFGTEGSRGRFDVRHNGQTVGEFVWSHPPSADPQVWQDRVLAGLNWAPPRASIAPPEPAPMRRAS